MAGFNAGDAVEPLEYDFTAFDGGAARIPEPSTEQISSYWAHYIGAIQIARLKAKAETDAEPKEGEEESVDDMILRVKAGEVSSAERSAETISRRRELIAELCSQQPSLEDVKKLPHRIFDLFETYVQKGISPEASSTATTS